MCGKWDVGDVGCVGCGMFGMWDVWKVGCWGCGIFGMWDVDLQNAVSKRRYVQKHLLSTFKAND